MDKNKVVETYYANGQLCLRMHCNDEGEPDGLKEFWHENGRLWTRDNYKLGKRDGLHELWREDGRLWVRENYKNGELNGLSERWDDNGRLWLRENYERGELNGLYEDWHDNGQLRSRDNYKDGELDGLSECWDSDGNLRYRHEYEHGVLPYKKEVARFHLTGYEEMALSSYQPVKVKDGWLQLDMNGHARIFKDCPGNIKDEVYDLAQELAPALKRLLKDVGADPSDYIRIKPKAEAEAEEARVRLGRDDEPKERVSKGIKM